MKKNLFRIVLFLLLINLWVPISFAVGEEMEEVLESQKANLNIHDFITEANKYTKENLGDIDMQDILSSAITGKVDHQEILKKILDPLGSEVKQSLTIMRKYFSHCFST